MAWTFFCCFVFIIFLMSGLTATFVFAVYVSTSTGITFTLNSMMPKCKTLYSLPSLHTPFLFFPSSLAAQHCGIWADSGPWPADCLVCLSMISFLKHVNSVTGRGQLAAGPINWPLADWTQQQVPLKLEAVIHILYCQTKKKKLHKPIRTCFWQIGVLNIQVLLYIQSCWLSLNSTSNAKQALGRVNYTLGQKQETLVEIQIEYKTHEFKVKLWTLKQQQKDIQKSL